MGVLSRRKTTEGAIPEQRQRTILAAAMPLTGDRATQAWKARSGGDEWQRQAWYYYDANGELRFAYRYLAGAVSRATLFAAETDPETGKITGPTEDARAQAAASAVLGTVEDRPRLQTLMALQWQVAGEFFLLVRPDTGSRPDRWYTLSSNAVRERGGRWTFKDPLTGVWEPVRSSRDKLIRVWSAHPDEQSHADSATRAALPVLAEIEKTSQAIAARLDSRLAGNGLLFVPNEMDFPTSDGEPADAQSLVKLMMDAASTAIQTPGTAAAQVPIAIQVAGELIGQIQHMDLSTDLDSALSELREGAVVRLGRTVEMPREIAMGETGEANHWTAWQLEESTYKLHVEPFLLEVAGALTREIYRPMLVAMGVRDPERFVLSWDISEVVSAPDQSENLRDLHDRVLVSDDYIRAQLGVPDDAIPDDAERTRRWAEKIAAASGAPALENASVAGELGLEPSVNPEPVQPSSPELDEPADGGSRELPERSTEPDNGLVAAAELVVFDALSRAGGRLLTPAFRGQFKTTPRHELHTVIPLEPGREAGLMEGSFQFADNVAHAFGLDPAHLKVSLSVYVAQLLRHGVGHDREIMRAELGKVPRVDA